MFQSSTIKADPFAFDSLHQASAHGTPPVTDTPLVAVSADTLLRSPDGPVAARDLGAGDLLLCMDGSPVPLHSVTLTRFSRGDLQGNRALAPIRFEAGSAADGLPRQTLLISPCMPVVSPMMGGQVRADHLVNGGTIRTAIPDEGITYITLQTATPALLMVDGLCLRFEATARPGVAFA
ncbi:hypothetical protein HKCCE4037_15040 [Rhodobacterales bacterium HKCCE4037]|nr:hypothetical protein [Rhodobacterales bacterium HKCCE4037]